MNIDLDQEDTLKYSFFPIEHPSIVEYFYLQNNAHWTVNELDISKDRRDFETLGDESVKEAIIKIHAFFSQIDRFVIENIVENLQKDTQDIKEASHFYCAQNLIETIHNQTYSLLIDTLIRDPEEKLRALDGVKNFPFVRTIADWMADRLDRNHHKLERIIANACVEGILFTGAFCFIYWVKDKYPDKLRGLTKANELISKDEALHTNFAIEEYREYTVRMKKYAPLHPKTIHNIIKSAIGIADIFVKAIIGDGIKGFTHHMMMSYLKCAADSLARGFGAPAIYEEKNLLPWTIMIGLENKTNFFEDTVAEYKKTSEKNWTFKVRDEF